MADAKRMAANENWWKLCRTLSQDMCGERGRRLLLRADICGMHTVKCRSLAHPELGLRAICCLATINVSLNWTTQGTPPKHFSLVVQSLLVRRVG